MSDERTSEARGTAPVSVVVATKGRARETSVLLAALARQSLQPNIVVVVGTCTDDLPADHTGAVAQAEKHPTALLLAPTVGLTAQRNYALEWLKAEGFLDRDDGFVVFFDDDYRPEKDWLRGCQDTFLQNPEIAGLTGLVLADGIKGTGLTEAEAEDYIAGVISPQTHWTNREHLSAVTSAYGCNMAFRSNIARQTRFDEALPLYGWQEDTDYTGRTRKFGPTVVSRRCAGVHLGVKNGRTSGVRVGYSQIANPLHIARSGNMTWRRAIHFTTRSLAANSIKSVGAKSLTDYSGRLRGNFIALMDLAIGRCAPGRILDL